jgi:hypothetical protein
MEHKIVTFGCWNNYRLLEDIIPMHIVGRYLKSVEGNYNDLIILGDNYYPQEKESILIDGVKVKKAKFNIDHFNSGFEMVNNLSIPNKYLIMGNHDVEDTLLDKCVGLKLQLDNANFNVAFPYGHKDIIVGSVKYKYIFIDTNLYNLKDKVHTCFNEVKGRTAGEILRDQNEFIRQQLLDTSVLMFIIFGHEPLISIKTKSSDTFDGVTTKSGILSKELIDMLFSVGKNILYVCADVHMYQYGDIRTESGLLIKQLVCGTGGADRDNICISKREYKIGGYNYELLNSVESFGYVEIILSERGIKHNYIKLKKSLEIERFNNKYKIEY